MADGADSDDVRSRQVRRPVLMLLHGDSSKSGRIGQLITAKGYQVEERKPRFGCAVPEDLRPYRGVVIFGGAMSSNDKEPWIDAEIGLARRAVAENVPFLGVCLGAQMLARALGARVAPHPERLVEIGYYRVTPTAAGATLSQGPWPSHVYHWHAEGFDLPAGAQLLATGSGPFPNQAFRYGNAIGVQFHPEITYTLVNTWLGKASHMLSLPGAQSAEEHRTGHLLHARAVERWLSALLDQWLADEFAVAA